MIQEVQISGHALLQKQLKHPFLLLLIEPWKLDLACGTTGEKGALINITKGVERYKRVVCWYENGSFLGVIISLLPKIQRFIAF